MFHIHNSTVCLSFWWLPHIRLINNVWWYFFSLFLLQIQAHIYIHSGTQLSKRVQKCFFFNLHCSRHAPKHLGIYFLWNVDNHYKIKSALHMFKVMETDLVTKLIVHKSLLVNKHFHSFIPSHYQHEKELPKIVKSQANIHIFGPYALTICISSTRPDQ